MQRQSGNPSGGHSQGRSLLRQSQPVYNIQEIRNNQFINHRASIPSQSSSSSSIGGYLAPPFRPPQPPGGPQQLSDFYFPSPAHRSSFLNDPSGRDLQTPSPRRLAGSAPAIETSYQLQLSQQHESIAIGSIPPPPPPLDSEAEGASTAALAPSVTLPSIKVVKNDYNQHFVDTGERPQNFIRDHEPHLRFNEYPKLEKLIRLKVELNEQRAHPPVHIQADLRTFDWTSLGCNFDVILVDPPWAEYAERLSSAGGCATEDLTPWTLEEILQYVLVDKIAEPQSFCFIWCGSQHLDDGRQLLQAWGFRRCEDICWLKTNKMQVEVRGSTHHTLTQLDENGLFQHTKEHCLMGVKGVVRRSQDTHFIHSNIDTDIIVEEEPTGPEGRSTASTSKPSELYDIIERFCLGKRKIELFGLDRNIRRGWLTVGKEVSVSNFDQSRYLSWTSDLPESGDGKFFTDMRRGRYIGSSPEIDLLRPKSPSRSTAPSKSSLG